MSSHHTAVPMVATVASTEAQREAARQVERDVFGLWFGATADELAVEFAPYEESSIFFLAHPYDDPEDVVAASRLVRPGPAGNKTLHYVSEEPWRADGVALAHQAGIDLARTWDVASVVAQPHGQSSGASAALYAGMLGYLPKRGADWWTSLIDTVVMDLAIAAGLPCQPLPTLTAGPFLGSPSTVPVFGAVADVRLVGDRRAPGSRRRRGQRDGAPAPVPARVLARVEEIPGQRAL
jgi:hypothetical protein